MIIEPDFLDHWKTQMLINNLNDVCAPIYLIRIWGHCQNRKTHGFTAGSFGVLAQRITAIAKYPIESKTDAELFLESLIECGFVDYEKAVDGEEELIEMHDWENANSSLIASWKNGGKGGRPRKTTHRKPTENPRVNPAHEKQNPAVTDREDREDKIEKRREENSAPPRVFETSGKISENIPAYLSFFQSVHPDCEKVSEMNFTAAIRAKAAWDAPASVMDEALGAFMRQCCDVVSFRPQTPIGKFENYLARSLEDHKKQAAGSSDASAPKRLKVGF